MNGKDPEAGNKAFSDNSGQSHWSLSYGKLGAVAGDKERKIG